VDPSEGVDEPTANSLTRIAEMCQFSDKTSVLDVGCGAGLPLRYYQNGGAPLSKLTGIDLSQGMLNHAKKSHPDSEFIKGDIHVFEDPDFRLFDRVVFNSCYQYLHDQELAIRHVCEELISGGGMLIICEPHGRRHVNDQKKANPRANLRSLPDKESLEGIVGSLGSGTTGVQSFTSSLLSVESMVDEEDFYCAVLRRSCADF
jgi:trans-aconitate methyltransferase